MARCKLRKFAPETGTKFPKALNTFVAFQQRYFPHKAMTCNTNKYHLTHYRSRFVKRNMSVKSWGVQDEYSRRGLVVDIQIITL
jgi:hypothetical protein